MFVLSALIAGLAGALYVPQIGIINPSEFSPANSIEIVIWVAIGGRGTLYGAVVANVRTIAGRPQYELDPEQSERARTNMKPAPTAAGATDNENDGSNRV